VLAIDGRSGSGKTTLAAALHAELDCPIVSLEDLYGGWEGLEHGISLLVREVLGPLAAGRAAAVPRFDWDSGTWGTPRILQPPDLLIVEGVGAGAQGPATYESVVAWLDGERSVRKNRAMRRDGELYEPFWDRWAAQEDRMLAREQTPARADLVIDTATGEVSTLT
jgi:uridine kinase